MPSTTPIAARPNPRPARSDASSRSPGSPAAVCTAATDDCAFSLESKVAGAESFDPFVRWTMSQETLHMAEAGRGQFVKCTL